MSTLDRYILKSFVRNLGLVLLTLLSLYGLYEFLETVDDFIEFHAEAKFYLLYPLYHLPVLLSDTLPMAVLLATFITIGGFSRTSQLTAMQSGGISLSRISRPLFLGSLILAMLVMAGNLWLVPWSARESNYMLRTEIKGKTPPTATSQDLYFRDGSRLISVNRAFPTKGMVFGLTIVEFNEKFLPIKRIQAEQAHHVERGKWNIDHAVVWSFDPGTRAVTSFQRQQQLSIDLKRRPEEMLQLWDRPEDLTIGELFDVKERLSNEGYDPKTYQVETQLRFAKTAIPVIMVLVGMPFALQRGRNSSFSLGIVTSLVIFFVYFVLYAVFVVFGAISVLPPFVAAWAANVLMALLGAWYFLKIQS